MILSGAPYWPWGGGRRVHILCLFVRTAPSPSHPPALGELLAPTKAPNGCLLEGRQDFTGVYVFLEELWRVAQQEILLSKFRICHKQFTRCLGMNIACLAFLLCLPFGLDVRATCPPVDFYRWPVLTLGGGGGGGG